VTAEARFLSRFDVPPEAEERLRCYAELAGAWNERINLFGRASIGDLWERHFADGARLAELVPDGPVKVCDLGSGGGVPGLVIAALKPRAVVTLVDSDARKGAFLREAARRMKLDCAVTTGRIEALHASSADVVTARALAPLPVLLGYARIHLQEGGLALFPKGRTWRTELAEAKRHWTFACDVKDGEGDGVVLCIRDPNER
jgi:16S rRNA (guanine527-N7)-methyltransferase